MEHLYYLPTRTTSLAHYFAKGIISPAACYTNKPDDIQENCPNALLINVRPVMTGSACARSQTMNVRASFGMIPGFFTAV